MSELFKIGRKGQDGKFEEISVLGNVIKDEKGKSFIDYTKDINKYLPKTDEINKGKVLSTNEDGSIIWIDFTAGNLDTYTKSQIENVINTKLAELIGGAPEDLDTLNELAEAVTSNRDLMDTLNSAISLKQDKITSEGILKSDGLGNISSAESGTDYVKPDGNVLTASKIKKPVNVSLTGGVIGETLGIDLSQDISIDVTKVDGTKIQGLIPESSTKKDVCFVNSEEEIASQNLRDGGIIFMKADNKEI